MVAIENQVVQTPGISTAVVGDTNRSAETGVAADRSAEMGAPVAKRRKMRELADGFAEPKVMVDHSMVAKKFQKKLGSLSEEKREELSKALDGYASGPVDKRSDGNIYLKMASYLIDSMKGNQAGLVAQAATQQAEKTQMDLLNQMLGQISAKMKGAEHDANYQADHTSGDRAKAFFDTIGAIFGAKPKGSKTSGSSTETTATTGTSRMEGFPSMSGKSITKRFDAYKSNIDSQWSIVTDHKSKTSTQISAETNTANTQSQTINGMVNVNSQTIQQGNSIEQDLSSANQSAATQFSSFMSSMGQNLSLGTR